MSIINEALKKAEEEKQKRKETGKEPASAQPESEGSLKQIFWKRNVILGSFILGILCIAAITVSLTSITKINRTRKEIMIHSPLSRESSGGAQPAVPVSSTPQTLPRTAKAEEEFSLPQKEKLTGSIDSAPSVPAPLIEIGRRRGREGPLPILSLKGIVWNKEKPLALIDNKILTEGDVIKEARRVSIGKKEVKLIFRGRKFTLRVH